MRTCFNPYHRAGLVRRLRAIRPDTPPRWGSMTAGQMLAHLQDSFAIMAGKRTVSQPTRKPPRFLRSAVGRWLLIDTPLPWPRGKVVAPPEFTATFPADFTTDRERVIAALERFSESPTAWPDHPAFGRIPERQWGRLAWKHMDHHLKQFGA